MQNISSFNSSIGNHLYFVSALNKCESYSKSTLSINIIQICFVHPIICITFVEPFEIMELTLILK